MPRSDLQDPIGYGDASASATSATMRAAVLSAPGRIEVLAVSRSDPAAHEVRVRVTAVGLCGTDFHIFAGHANYHRDDRGRMIPLAEAPQILGHEIAGVVEEVGAEVEDLRPGDAVVLDQGRTCVGERREVWCEYCCTGDSHQCEQYREHGITGLPGGLAEYVVVPAANALRVESGLAPEVAALTEPLGCIVHSTDLIAAARGRYTLAEGGADRRARAVLVCGGGPAGLLFVQFLRDVLGFEGRLLVSEPNALKRSLAEGFGAETIDPSAVDVAEAVREATAGRGVELLIEASGAGSVFEQIPALLRKQGTLLLYGHGHHGVDLSVLNGVQFLEPTLVAPAGASGGFEPDGRPSTYLRALRLVEGGRIDVASLITHRYRSLDAVPAAFAGDHRDPGYLKGVVVL
ncbi:MAG TPA: alcohol dehydrogenase catalytic domain-containing protein [Longimicrobiaceae bacterium]|nr:alcohol dehydrogenase catalytic domain-containing protein [Longimicrobiaceae bacterium]